MNEGEIRRGDIFYIHKFPVVGSEIEADGRPAIIVSNDMNNQYSQVVEVVFLTTQAKKPMPTHVSIYSAPRPSTALCEQVSTVSVERIGNYAGHLTEKEMTQVDTALLISLDLALVETGNGGGVALFTRKAGGRAARACFWGGKQHDRRH